MTKNELDQNLVQIFLSRVACYQNRPALYYKDKSRGNDYVPVHWTDWSIRVRDTAMALRAFGAARGDRIGILSENRPEWTYADLGILSLGCVNVPVYPTSSCPDLAYYIENSGMTFFFISTAEQFNRVKDVLLSSSLRKIVTFDDVEFKHDKVISFRDFLEAGKAEHRRLPDFFEQSVNQVSPDEPATIIYTSGTTGAPKGVVLSHRNFVANYLGSKHNITILDSDVALSFLPLNHVFERLAGYYFMVFHGASIAYAESMQTVAADMAVIRPTVAAAVPRFYEKVYAGILEKVQNASPIQKKIFKWAVRTGRKRYADRLSGRRGLWDRVEYAVARTLVFNKIKAKLGGRLRFFISGGAPLSKDLAEFFYAADILILEGYGLTETSPVIAVNTVRDFRFGTVGPPLPNIEVKIAEDGEILTKGPCVMQGYYRNPEATAEVMSDGWFHTGDIGLIDGDGFLKITDRKKDIIATSGGKKVSPQNIENRIQSDPLFTTAVIVGDRRNYLTALIVPDRAEVMRKAAELGCDNKSWPEILADDRIYAWANQRLQEVMKEMASYEQIKYFTFLPVELSTQNGELTPTMKVKRKAVTQKYADLIDAMYLKGAGHHA